MKRQRKLLLGGNVIGVAMIWAASTTAIAQEKVGFSSLDALLAEKPLPAGSTADIVASRHVDASALQVVVARKIDLHIHDDTDHIVYVARGKGVFHFAGQERPVEPGDIVTIPRGIVHGFEARQESEPLVLLVVETPG